MRDHKPSHPVDRLLRSAAGDPIPSTEDRSHAEAALRSAILEAGARRRPNRRRWHWRVPALAGSLVVLLVAVVILQVSEPSLASAAMEEIAAVVELVDPVSIPNQSYAYTRSEGIVRGVVPPDALEGRATPLTYHLPWIREIWVGSDGVIQIRATNQSPTFFTLKDEADYYTAGLDKIDRVNETVTLTGVGGTSLLDEREWPTIPHDLEAAITESLPTELAKPHNVAVADLALTLITETAATPQLRAAALRVLSGLTGIGLDERRPDGGGTFSLTTSNQAQPTRLVFTLDGAGNVLRITVTDIQGDPAAGIPPHTLISDIRYEPTRILTSPDSP